MKNMNRKTRKTLSVVLALAVVLLAFSACAKQNTEPPVTPDPTPVLRDTLRIATESEPPTLHPYDHTAVTAGYMNAMTFDTLFKAHPETLEPYTSLVKEYEQLDDSTWSFTIYDNVDFHDGTHMTAEDVVASMEYGRTYPTTKNFTAFWTGLKVTGEYTFEVTTDGPYALVLVNLCSIKVVPKALIDSGNDFNKNPIGSGPYKFVSQTLGESIAFVKNESYFDPNHQPSITNVVWRIIPEGSSRTIALEGDEVDLVIEVSTNDTKRLNEAENITVHTVPGTRLNFLTMNSEVAPFDNKLFRKAVNAAINKESVIAVALDGEGILSLAQSPTVFPGTSLANADGYNLELAKQYLAESGVDVTGLTIPCIVSTDTARKAAEVIQNNLLELGITMTIDSMDYSAYLTHVMGGDYVTAVSGYTSADLNVYLSGVFHSSAINAANMGRVDDEYVDSLITLAKTQTDEAERTATLQEVTAYLNDLCTFAPLYGSVVTRACNAKLQGVTVGANGTLRLEDVYWTE